MLAFPSCTSASSSASRASWAAIASASLASSCNILSNSASALAMAEALRWAFSSASAAAFCSSGDSGVSGSVSRADSSFRDDEEVVVLGGDGDSAPSFAAPFFFPFLLPFCFDFALPDGDAGDGDFEEALESPRSAGVVLRDAPSAVGDEGSSPLSSSGDSPSGARTCDFTAPNTASSFDMSSSGLATRSSSAAFFFLAFLSLASCATLSAYAAASSFFCSSSVGMFFNSSSSCFLRSSSSACRFASSFA
mmetsp:Transcript_142573/g.248602  ORF Transcript_142573/g.248602 Transcript_142573/m.248602 type:complete len:250 (+) Transcript_142573:3737-4486(+)